MRIIAGSARGTVLLVPARGPVRPTADRVKESLFNILGQFFDGGSVLDLYAGVGGLGLEALSRGAASLTAVESDRWVLEALRANVDRARMTERVVVVPRAVEAVWDGLRGPFDLVLCDPPYALHVQADVLRHLDARGLVAPGGDVVLEHASGEVLPEQVGSLVRTDQRRFGDTVVSFYGRVQEAA